MQLLDFPNELLIEIFHYIDVATFKSITLTCRRLKNLAEISRAMDRIRISLVFPDSSASERIPRRILDFFRVFLNTQRTYRNLCIKYLKIPLPANPLIKDNLRDLLLKHKFDTVNFDMFNMFLDEFDTIAVNLIGVKSVQIYRSYLHKVGSMKSNATFPNLEKLILFHSGSYLEVFKSCTAIKQFRLEYITIFDKPLLEQIIFQQENLRSIEFNNIAKCDLFRTPLNRNNRCMVRKLVFNEIFYDEIDGYFHSLNKAERIGIRDGNGYHFLDKFFSQISNMCPYLEEFVLKSNRAVITNHQIQILCSEHKKLKRLELGFAVEKLNDETLALLRKMPNAYKFRFIVLPE